MDTDLPEVRYHFPQTYLKQVQKTVGDWIVYYEPRRSTDDLSSRGGRQTYFAIAFVVGIEPDPQKEGHFYAYVKDYLEFDRPVPFRYGDHYFETALRRDDGKTSKGAFGRAVRAVPESEFKLIVEAGFAPELTQSNYPGRLAPANEFPGFLDDAGDDEPADRRLIEVTLTRPFRDEAFRRHVCAAYSNQCALSGLKLINGGGRAEVQAAHIRPVASNGPDSVRNGLALSGTLHWMFDRGLIAVADDWGILRAQGLPDEVSRLIVPGGRLILPKDHAARPHSSFLRYHRENIFKGKVE